MSGGVESYGAKWNREGAEGIAIFKRALGRLQKKVTFEHSLQG